MTVGSILPSRAGELCCGRLARHFSMVFVVGGLSLLGLSNRASAQGKHFTVHSKSQFWIRGEATTHDFTCVVSHVGGMGQLPSTQDTVPASADEEQAMVRVRVPVQAFECGNRPMTQDLQETLKVEEHPEIRFELVHASVVTPTDSSAAWRTIEVLGALTIAGMKRLIRLRAVGRALDENHFRVRGCKPIRMTYFGIDPPTKALGLVRVENRVEVQFDLFAQAAEAAEHPLGGLSLGKPPSCED